MIVQVQMHKNLILMFVFLFFGVAQAQVPSEPTNLVVTPINTGGMIQFTAPSSIGGAAISNYEYSINNGEWVTPNPAIAVSPLIISSGLINCTSNQVKLRAVNTSGSGPASDFVALIPAVSNSVGVNWATRENVGFNCTSIIFGNGLFVAVGSNGQVITSPDGVNWTSRTSVAANNSWNSVTFGNGLFVAVASNGTGNRVMTSADGFTWTSKTSAVDNNWTSVTYGNGLFVAVALSGTGNRVMTSTNGFAWTSRTSAADNNWAGVAYGNGLFVAVANTGTGNRVMTSLNGTLWTTRLSAADDAWRGLTYGNGLFAAVANSVSGKCVMTSSFSPVADAPVINSINPRNNAALVAFSSTLSVFAMPITNYEYSKNDGLDWIVRSPASNLSPLLIDGLTNDTPYAIKLRAINAVGNSCESIAFAITPSSAGTVAGAPTNLVATPINTGGLIHFAAPLYDGGSDITNYEYSINNGAQWVTRTPASTASPLFINGDLINCNSYAVKLRAVNASGEGASSEAVTLKPSVSNFGVDWTARTPAANIGWFGVAYGNGLFVAVANSGSGNRVMTSLDGITWTSRTSAADNYWIGITYGNGLFVAVANTGNGNRVMTSPDGISWTARTSAADNSWYSVTYGNELFVAVANSGTGNRVMTSPDGIAWTSGVSAADNDWLSVTYGNGLFVAVAGTGTGNRVMTSPDGMTWTTRNSAADNYWRCITFGNGLFVAVANSGTGNRVMTSSDGFTWTARNAAAENSWNAVTYGNGLFVAVANTGTGNRVMTSLDGISWTTRTSAADKSWYCVTYGNGLFVAVSVSGYSVTTSSFSTVADAPVITSATLGTSSSVNFTQSASALAPAITNYEYSTENGSNWTAVSPAATTSPLTITGLATVPSSIMIRAVNSVGNSCPSQNYLNNYNITFDANEGIGSMATQTIAYTNSTNLTANAFTRTGYTFAGWATTSGGAVAYANSVSYTMGSADVTLFAKWNLNGTTTQLRPMHCGKTLRWLDEKIQATPVSGATQYRFEVIRTDNALDSRTITINTYLFNPATQLLGGLIYGKSYFIRVKTFIGTTENPYGNTCIVTAPAEPLCCTVTKLRAFQCEATLRSMTDVVEATPVYKATTYEFEVTSAAGTFVKSSPNYTFSLYYSVPGRALYGTAYSIRVRSKGAATAFTAWGDPCVVTTPIARMSNSIESDSIFNVKAFPNPFASHFSVDIESSSDAQVELKVYDMIGRQLEVRKATVSELSVLEVGRNYPSGVYNVVVSQRDKGKSLRLIKR